MLSCTGSSSAAPETPAGVVTNATRNAHSAPTGHSQGMRADPSPYDRPMDEAQLRETDAGLVPAGPGWFVVNAREARWVERPGRGHNVPLTGWTEDEAETWFAQLGINVAV